MKIFIRESGKEFCIDLLNGIDVSIPVNFNGEQPNTYDVDKASAKAIESGIFIGDTRRGGGCNFEEFRMIPHCNGTHTECVGHISYDRIHINRFVNRLLIPSTLISVTPEVAVNTTDSYDPQLNDEDMLISRRSLESKLSNTDPYFLNGLLIRTFPNEADKKSRRYSKHHPPFFSIEAMEYVSSLGVENLLIDIPSVDRTFDEGKLSAHHIFWNVKGGSHDVNPDSCSGKTITEMIYVDDEIADGHYFTSVHIPNLCADAAPSRVLLYRPESH
jgi:kynurenine formamidase